MLPIIVAKTSAIMILPTTDLKFHVLDIFIKSLRSWIDSNRLFDVNLQQLIVIFPIIFSCAVHVSPSGRLYL